MTVKAWLWPIPTQCSYWVDGQRCKEPATHELWAHGQYIGKYCAPHGKIALGDTQVMVVEEKHSV